MAEVENTEIQSPGSVLSTRSEDCRYETLYNRMVLFTFFVAGPALGIAMSLKMFGVATIGTIAFAFLTVQNKRYRLAAIVYTALLAVATAVCLLRH